MRIKQNGSLWRIKTPYFLKREIEARGYRTGDKQETTERDGEGRRGWRSSAGHHKALLKASAVDVDKIASRSGEPKAKEAVEHVVKADRELTSALPRRGLLGRQVEEFSPIILAGGRDNERGLVWGVVALEDVGANGLIRRMVAV